MGALHRREVLAMLGAGLAAAATAGCSRGGTATSAATPSTTVPPTTAPPTTAPFDPATPWWLQGNFAPVTQEVEALDLAVTGALPRELSGLYVRNGSNPRTGQSPHWFLGDGMLHGIRVEGGEAKWYRNRYVRTPLYEASAGFGDGVPGGATTQSNVSAITHAGRLLTSGEVGLPYRIDATDLATVGPHDFDGRLTTSMTAHPKVDPDTGRLHFFGYGFTPPYLTYHVAGDDGALVASTEIPVAGPTMIHDFAITDREAVFWELPVVFDLEAAVAMVEGRSGAFPFRWDPAYGARVGVLPFGAAGGETRWFEIEPCYVFHGVNAFRDGDDVVLDVCRLSSVFAGGEGALGGDLSLRRWTVNTATGRVRDEVVDDHDPGELPNRDPRRVGRRHRHGYLVQSRENDRTADLGGLIKHDFDTGRREVWDPGPHVHGGEWLFVPGEDAGDGDDEGWVLGIVHDESTGVSSFVVFDATAVGRGPVASVALPQRVPYGFHGTWVPA